MNIELLEIAETIILKDKIEIEQNKKQIKKNLGLEPNSITKR